MADYIIHGGNLYRCDNELYHHGVKGMKWGVRRYQNKDGSLTNLGKQKYGSATTTAKKNDSKPANSRDHSQSDKSPLAWYITNIGLDILSLNVIGLGADIARGVQAVQSSIRTKKFAKDREGCETDESTGLLKKKREMTEQEDAARVNPEVYNFNGNTKNNCMLCSITYDLRRRGYEVTANKASKGYLMEELGSWYTGAKPTQKTYKSQKEMRDQLKAELVKQGDGARGNLGIVWAGLGGGGHSIVYEVKDGQLRLIDAQIGKVYDNPDRVLKHCYPIAQYCRTDNLKINKKTIGEVCR